MMKKSDECKIVKDLLPNYLENLTELETNEFIEKHIENCGECEQSLKDMKGEIQLHKIQNNKKINAFKKVKRKYRIIIVAILLSIIVIFGLAVHFLINYNIIQNQSGKYEIVKTTPNYDIRNDTYIILKGYIDEGLKADITYIATINENDICINIRQISQEYSKQFAQEEFERLQRMDLDVVTNLKLQDSRIYQNLNLFNGKTKDELIENFKNSFKNVSIIYI